MSCSLVWHWLYEHACWFWECVFLLPPDQFQRKLPAAIPWPGPYPLLSTWGLPPSVEWLVASLIPLPARALPVCDFHHMQYFLWHELYLIYLHIGRLHLELGFIGSAAANSYQWHLLHSDHGLHLGHKALFYSVKNCGTEKR